MRLSKGKTKWISLIGISVACAAIYSIVCHVQYSDRESADLDLLANEYNISDFYIVDGVLHDNAEKSEHYMDSVAEAEKKARLVAEEMVIPAMGKSFFIQKEKKMILKEDYGVNWRTPSEMNPWHTFN